MSETYTKIIRNKISEKLINPDFDPNYRGEDQVLFSNKQIMFEQYKVLVDAAYKTEERRAASNNIFLGINTLIASFLVRPTQFVNMQEKDLSVAILITLIGVFVSWEWLRVTASYKKINFINYSLINSLEKFLPVKIFSLKGEIEVEQEEEKPTNAGNVILTKENLLPKAFFFLYLIYLLSILSCFFPL